MARGKNVLFSLAISILLLSHLCVVVVFSSSPDPKPDDGDDDDEDLSFLEEPLDSSSSHLLPDAASDSEAEEDDEPFDNDDSFGMPSVDDKDVVVLTAANFTDFVSKSKHVLVEFYAPWCGHCHALAPEYAHAASELKGLHHDVSLAKVDATEEEDLSQNYGIEGYPTLLFFVDGQHKPYPGQTTKEAIVTWIKKKIGPGVHNITTIDEAQTILTSQRKMVLAFLDSLVGTDSQELASASKLEDDVTFYQTVNPDVAKLFNIDPNSKLPSLVSIKEEDEKVAYFDGPFTKSAIADFVFSNKIPLVTYFTRESAPLLFENPIKKQLLLFATSNHSEKVIPLFEVAAKSFKGKIIFVYVEMDNEDVGVPVANYFGITGDKPKVLAYTGNEDAKKHIFDGELTAENVKVFGEDFLQDKLMPFYKSDPIPETNDGDVKVVVGNNFDEIVLDESKDILLEIYAPWCGHCQALEPIYNKLAKHLTGIESLVIAKMDGTTNEHPRAKADGFPTLLFFPAGNKNFEPITVETDRTVVAFYKFIKKHASIPFKLQKPASAVKSESTDAAAAPESKQSSTDDPKDEL